MVGRKSMGGSHCGYDFAVGFEHSGVSSTNARWIDWNPIDALATWRLGPFAQQHRATVYSPIIADEFSN